MFKLRTILVPTDYSPTSEAALTYAIDLARLVGATVHVLHAYEIPVYGAPDTAFIAPPETMAAIKVAAKKGLDTAIAKFQSGGVPLEGHLAEGRAWEAIHDTAAQVGADLIVIGTHGRRGIARALLGSVAEKVVRSSKVPVLTVHDDPEGHPHGP
jgi:nucleotide-binding universal stress UspA family protein